MRILFKRDLRSELQNEGPQRRLCISFDASDENPSGSPTSSASRVTFGPNAVTRRAFFPVRLDRTEVRAFAPFTVDGLPTTKIDESWIASGVTTLGLRGNGYWSFQ
jgi:hypothetical protein